MTIKFHDWATAAMTAQLGWTLLHFVWQGTLIAIFSAIGLRILRRRSAPARYLMACAALALMAACPLATFAWCHSERVPRAAVSVDTPLPEFRQQLRDEPQPAIMTVLANPLTVEVDDPTADLLPAASAPSVPQPIPVWIRAQQQLEPYVPWLVALWLCGVAVLSLRLLCAWHWIYRLSHSSVQAVPEPLRERLAALAGALSISRPVRLVESVLVEVPTVIGWLRPLILLPSSALVGLTASQLEALLAHELAHISRHDFLVNLWQTVVETLLFYHPAVWWLSQRIRSERELCCDDLAVAICSNRVAYARALADMESLRATPRLSVAANGGSLQDRVRRLVAPGTELPRSGGWTASLCALATALLLCVFAFAGPQAEGLADDAGDMTQEAQGEEGRDDREQKDDGEQPKAKAADGTGPVVITLPDGARIEILGVATAGTLDRALCWRPDGSPFPEAQELPKLNMPPDQRATQELICRYIGFGDGQSLSWKSPTDTDNSLTVVGWRNRSESWIRAANLQSSANEVSLRVGISENEWGPWQTVSAEGKAVEPVTVRPSFRDLYATVKPDHVQQYKDVVGLRWNKREMGSYQVVAVDQQGQRHAPSGTSAWTDNGNPGVHRTEDQFRIAAAEVDHFEYRLRPVLYWVDIENVSLRQGHRTQVKTRVERADAPVERAKPFIVRLTSEKQAENGQKPMTGLGTGVILDQRGYVLTMRHIAEGAAVRATLADGTTRPATVVGIDKEHNLALLKIDVPLPLPVVRWGQSKFLQRGDAVTAIGQWDDQGLIAAQGAITATNRDLKVAPDLEFRRLLQLDADLKPGCSGGPVLNSAGEVIGMCVAFRIRKPNMSLAFPIDDVRPVADKLLALATATEPAPGAKSEPKPNSESRAVQPTHGIFSGSIRLTGPLPPVPAALAKKGGKYSGGTISEDVPDERLLIDRPPVPVNGQRGGTNGIANVAVYLKKAPAIPGEIQTARNEPELPALKISLKNYAFSPRVTLWRVGQPLELINTNVAAVNFKAFPTRNTPFNLLVAPGETKTVPAPFEAETTPAVLDSNILSWLRGYLLILDHPYAAVTNARGEFEIPQLPPGDYEFTIWHEQAGYLHKALKVTIAAGQSTVADMQFVIPDEGRWVLAKTERTETGISAIPADIQQQVQVLAAKHRAARGGLSSRRPAALRGLAMNDPRVKTLAAQAVRDLDSPEKSSEEARLVLAYLGELADEFVMEGTRSENPLIAARCCGLLMHRGPKAIAPLIAALKHSDEGVRTNAAQSLGQSFDPAAVGPLLEALPQEKHPVSIIWALLYLRDPRAIEPLRKWTNHPSYGQIATDAIRHIQFSGGYAYWPPESLPDRLLCRDAETWRGESYGPREIQRMIELLSSADSNISSEAALFLGRSHADDAVPALAKGHYGYTEIALAEIASPEAIGALFRRLHTPDPALRVTTIDALGSADRWAVPLLIALLDDRSLFTPGQPLEYGIATTTAKKWPDTHRAHSALWQLLYKCGLPGKTANLAVHDAPDIMAEIPRVKTWWKTYGNDFLDGKEVPNPNLTNVMFVGNGQLR
ncbi:MAG: trypsin-like peptidase domain-containing protein [Planctomycetes bacterium]|nr:trypsin-like peptidase domain-containing protein [Planctomycetota bacterium]